MLDSVGTPLGTMQSLLGHSTPEITREIYLHAIPEEQRRAVESVRLRRRQHRQDGIENKEVNGRGVEI
jgi:integrase